MREGRSLEIKIFKTCHYRSQIPTMNVKIIFNKHKLRRIITMRMKIRKGDLEMEILLHSFSKDRITDMCDHAQLSERILESLENSMKVT